MQEANIIRGDCPTNFTQISNALINDPALTMEAGFVLIWFLSKPPHWRVNPAATANHFKVSLKRIWQILKVLVDAGYVNRTQDRGERSRFKTYNYTVFGSREARKAWEAKPGIEGPQPENQATDSPYPQNGSAEKLDVQAGLEPDKQITDSPSSQNGSAENSQELTALPFTAVRRMGVLEKKESSNSLRKDSAFAIASAGGEPPSVSKQIWDEGRTLLSSQAPSTKDSIIGRWFKRASTQEGRAKLLGMIRAAAAAGTGDPVAYITAALAKEFPPPPKPETFDTVRWQLNAQAAIKTKSWSDAWGPAPGKKGCKMPAELITPELTTALSARRIAL